MNSPLAITVLAFLLLAVNANYTISINCTACSGGSCVNLTGGVFDTYIAKTNKTCADWGLFSPINMSFTCDSTCPQSCGFVFSILGKNVSQCANTTFVTAATTQLNIFYSYYMNNNNLTSAYNWCASSCARAGISGTVAAYALMGIAGLIIFYVIAATVDFWKKFKLSPSK